VGIHQFGEGVMGGGRYLPASSRNRMPWGPLVHSLPVAERAGDGTAPRPELSPRWVSSRARQVDAAIAAVGASDYADAPSGCCPAGPVLSAWRAGAVRVPGDYPQFLAVPPSGSIGRGPDLGHILTARGMGGSFPAVERDTPPGIGARDGERSLS
jgi:hypothetical protein